MAATCAWMLAPFAVLDPLQMVDLSLLLIWGLHFVLRLAELQTHACVHESKIRSAACNDFLDPCNPCTCCEAFLSNPDTVHGCTCTRCGGQLMQKLIACAWRELIGKTAGRLTLYCQCAKKQWLTIKDGSAETAWMQVLGLVCISVWVQAPFLRQCMSCMSRIRSACGTTSRTLNEYASSE